MAQDILITYLQQLKEKGDYAYFQMLLEAEALATFMKL